MLENTKETSDSEEENYTYTSVPCYRLIRRGQSEQSHPTDERLNATAREFHSTLPQDKQVQRDDTLQVMDNVQDPVDPEHQVEEQPRERSPEELVPQEEEHPGISLRRSQRNIRTREMFTYDALGQPTYHQWNPGVNSLIPGYPITSTVVLPYVGQPYLCYSQVY
ncbi:unnamed protein product [Knipowitschia caucasica]